MNEEEEIKREVQEVVKWTSVSGEKLTRLFAIYKLISGDNTTQCSKCPSAIRVVFQRVRKYNQDNYEEQKK